LATARYSVALALLVFFISACVTRPSFDRDTLDATSNPLQILSGGEASRWTLVREQNPDIFATPIGPEERREVCFVSAEQSLCRDVRLGDQFDFIIRFEGYDYPTRIVGIAPAATFSAAYQAEHRGRIEVEVPEVYELVNIAISITPTARANQYLVSRNNPYYTEMDAWFSALNDHPFVAALDRELAANENNYFDLKMNAYAFVFDANGRIEQSSVYNRTGFTGSAVNGLSQHFDAMQSFADDSRFREFYRAHRDFYRNQERYYRDEVGLEAMLTWLRSRFPNVRSYDGYKVVFSPLVGGNQSVTWLENNGYRELQAHVNFACPSRREVGLAPESVPLRRGRIVFTELNHGFINPAADRYAQNIQLAMNNRAFWAKGGSSSDNYRNELSLFLEYMNWALISLYEHDNAPDIDRERLNADLDRIMGDDGRGFSQFAQFRAELLRLYRERPLGATVESLYPPLIAWCEAHQASAAPQ
jgi:hypothetical protein